MHEDETINYEELILTIQRPASKIDRLQKQLDAIGSIETSANDEIWMTLKELQAYLPTHPSESTVRRLIASKRIPSYRSGKRVLVRRSDVDEWLASSKRMLEIESKGTTITFKRGTTNLPPWRRNANLKMPIQR